MHSIALIEEGLPYVVESMNSISLALQMVSFAGLLMLRELQG